MQDVGKSISFISKTHSEECYECPWSAHFPHSAIRRTNGELPEIPELLQGLMGSVIALERLCDAGKSQIHVQRLQEQAGGPGLQSCAEIKSISCKTLEKRHTGVG